MRLTNYFNKVLSISFFYLLVSLVTVVNAGVITQTASRSAEFTYVVDVGDDFISSSPREGEMFFVDFDLHDRSRGILNEVIFEQTLTGVLSGTVNNRFQDGGPAEVKLDPVSSILTGSSSVPNGIDTFLDIASATVDVSSMPDTSINIPEVTFISRTVTQNFFGADASAFIGIFQPSFAYEFGFIREIEIREIPPLGLFCADGRPADGTCYTSVTARQLYTNDISLTYRFTDAVEVGEPTSMWLMLLGISAIVLRKKTMQKEASRS